MTRRITTRARCFATAATITLVACDDASKNGSSAPAGTATTSAVATAPRSASPAASASASSAPTGSAAASSAAAAGPARAFAGHVDVKQAKVKVQSGVKVGAWRKDEGKELVGKCDVDLVLAGDGTVSGSVKGALGDLVITGAWDGKLVHAEIASQDVTAEGAVRGTIEATLEGDAITGKLRVASNDASLVREADVSLKPKH